MIHPMCLPEDDRTWLDEVMTLQLTILKIASALSTKISDDGSELRQGLNELAKYQANAGKITEWVIRKDGYQPGKRTPTDATKPTSFFGRLQTFSAFSDPDAKLALCRQIEADMALLKAPQAQLLQTSFIDGEWRNAVGQFLYQWYDLWSTPGFNRYLLQTFNADKYSRADFVQHIIQKNPHLVICPICDASSYRNETSAGTYTSIDHFFPRSKYPHLGLHPYNLLPMCPACNSGEAGQTDPQNGITAITDLVLPYHESTKTLAGHTYAKIEFRPLGVNQPASHALTFSLHVSAGETTEELTTQIANFERIYGVQQRWNKDNNLTLIDEHVFRRIRQFLLADIERGEPLHDPQFLLERLELLMALIDQQSLGQDPFSYMMTWWLMFHVNRLEKQREKIANLAATSIDCATLQADTEIEPIFKELYCWAKEQQKVFSELNGRIVNLRARIPQPTTQSSASG